MTIKSDSGQMAQMLRLVLYKGEIFRLPGAPSCMRVLSGNAWLTVDGQDIIVAGGETASVRSKKDAALVSTFDAAPLVIELCGCKRSRPAFGRLSTQIV
jgi:hypothetical protein